MHFNADYTGFYTVLVLLIINFLISAGYLIRAIFYTEEEAAKRRQCLLVAFCVLLGPVISPVVMLGGHLLSKLFYRHAGNLAEVTFSKERVESTESGNFDLEANFVPIQEALSISDTARMRRLMLDVLRNGVSDSLAQITSALKSTDSETSHYAAAAIVDVLSDFRMEAARLDGLVRENPQDVNAYVELIELLVEFLPQGVLHDNELELYTKMADDSAERLFELDSTALSPKHYLGLVNASIDMKYLDVADRWSERAFEFYPAELETYVGKLRLCFEKHDNEGFIAALGDLKKSGIIVDKKTMELIRLFQ